MRQRQLAFAPRLPNSPFYDLDLLPLSPPCLASCLRRRRRCADRYRNNGIANLKKPRWQTPDWLFGTGLDHDPRPGGLEFLYRPDRGPNARKRDWQIFALFGAKFRAALPWSTLFLSGWNTRLGVGRKRVLWWSGPPASAECAAAPVDNSFARLAECAK